MPSGVTPEELERRLDAIRRVGLIFGWTIVGVYGALLLAALAWAIVGIFVALAKG